MQFKDKNINVQMKTLKIVIYSFSILLIVSCESFAPPSPEENELLDGPMDGLTTEQNIEFIKGDQAFGDVFTIEKGLGPLFNANQCSSCHPGDGKGFPFVRFTRFGQTDHTGNKFLNQGAPQLQNKAIPGYLPEILPNGATSSDLIAPAVTGLGFLDAVSDAYLIALSDSDDSNGDGISGRPHWIDPPSYIILRPNSITIDEKYIARFGKKGAAYDLLHQTVNAYNQDMGITSSFEPIDTQSGLEIDPEVDKETINHVVQYLKTLKAPIPRDENNDDVLAGKQIFNDIDCAACHIPTLKSGYSPIDALSNKEFHPFTDLLLHDMGSALDDNYTEGNALTSEWKTPALWGLGLSKDTQGGTYFLLHDGRATSIEEAILFHGGEAEQSKNNYKNLSITMQNQLVKFLESL